MIDHVVRLRRRVQIALVIAVLTPLLSALSLPLPALRVPLALAFFLVVPGIALAELIRLPSEAAGWCIALAFSLACNILAAQIQLVVDSWHPLAGSTAVAAIGVLLTACVMWRERSLADSAVAAP